MEINRNQRRRVVVKLRKALGSLDEKVIGVLGLSFKPNTDDIREAPAIEVIHLLQNEGAKIQAYDPQAMENVSEELHHVKLCENAYQVAEGADALLLATEWNEFKQLDFKKIKALMGESKIIMDSRNLWDPDRLTEMGFNYFAVGRGPKNQKNGK